MEELRDGELAILYPLGVSGDGSVVVGLLDLEGYDDGLVWSRAWGIQRIEDVLGQYGIEFSHPIHVSDVSDDGLTFVGAASVDALDPVWIAELPRLCRVDLDDDERLTIFDFLAFQRAFGSEQEEADFAAPYGVLDAMDYLAFQSLFGTGC